MKQYTVEIAEEAFADMEQLYNHIAFKKNRVLIHKKHTHIL